MYDSLLPGQRPRLPTGTPGLIDSFVHGTKGRQLLHAIDGIDVEFNHGRIRPRQIEQHRPSYIHAILIQSRGRTLAQPCTSCRGELGSRVFPECRHVPGFFGGACANCKQPDRAIGCSVRDENWTVGVASTTTIGGSTVQRAISSAQSPINLDPEEGEHQDNPIDVDGEEGGEDKPIKL